MKKKQKKREQAPGSLILKLEKWRGKGWNHINSGGGVIVTWNLVGDPFLRGTHNITLGINGC